MCVDKMNKEKLPTVIYFACEECGGEVRFSKKYSGEIVYVCYECDLEYPTTIKAIEEALNYAWLESISI